MANTISNNLSSQLQQLTELANNKKLSAEEKKAALETMGAKTLAEINAEMPSLNFTSSKFAEKIAKLITDGKYNLLPLPAKMSTDLQALRLVAVALQDNSNTMSIDITSIMRFLAEAHRTLATINSNSEIQNRKLKLEAAKNEFEAKEIANKEQLTADLLTSASEIVMGAVQLTGSAISLGGAIKNIAKSKVVLKDTQALNNLTENKKIAHQNLTDSAKELDAVKPAALKEIKRLAQKDSAGTASLVEKTQLKSLRDKLAACESKLKHAQSEFSIAEKNENVLSKMIDTDNLKIKASTQKYEGFQQITTSSATILKGIGQSISAVYTFRASTERLAADKQGLEKDMAGQSEQSAKEGFRNMMEGSRNTIQSLSAMEQSISSSMTSMARI